MVSFFMGRVSLVENNFEWFRFYLVHGQFETNIGEQSEGIADVVEG